MYHIFTSYVQNSLILSFLTLLWWMVSKGLHRTFKMSALYYSGVVLLLGFLIPFRLPLTIAVQETLPEANAAAVPAVFYNAQHAVNLPGQEQTNTTAPQINWYALLAMVWIVVTVLLVVKYTVQNMRAQRYYKRWGISVTSPFLLQALEQVKAELDITQNIPVLYCPGVSSPMMVGVFAPKLILPPEMGRRAIEHIYRHELIHYKRKDIWVKLLSLAVRCIHWFNPAVYLLIKKVNFYCELSCDETTMQNTSAYERTCYSEAVIETAFARPLIKNHLSTNFNGGQKDMKERITEIMNTQTKKRGIAIVSLMLLATLLVGYLCPINVKADTPDISPNTVEKTVEEENDKRKVLEIGTRTVANERLLNVNSTFDFGTLGADNSTYKAPDVSNIEYYDTVLDKWINANELTYYTVRDSKVFEGRRANKSYMLIPNSVDTVAEKKEYLNKTNVSYLPPYKATDTTEFVVSEEKLIGKMHALELKLNDLNSRGAYVKVDGKIVPMYKPPVVSEEEKSAWENLVSPKFDDNTSTLFSGCTIYIGGNLPVHIFTTDMEKLKENKVMKIIEQYDWHVMIEEVEFSNAELNKVYQKLEKAKGEFDIEQIINDNIANGFTVSLNHKVEDVETVEQEIRDYIGFENINIMGNNTFD